MYTAQQRCNLKTNLFPSDKMYTKTAYLALLLSLTATNTFCHPLTEGEVTSQAISKRQVGPFPPDSGPCQWKQTKAKTKQTYYDQQVSDVFTCGSDKEGCSGAHAESASFAYSVDAGLNINFLSIGSSVTKSWTSGNSFTCNGNTKGDTCIWIKVAYTQYEVEPGAGNCNGVHGKHTMKAPNTNNKGGKYYCVNGKACRAKGDGYWHD